MTAASPRPLTRARVFSLAWLVLALLYGLQSYTFRLTAGQEIEWGVFLASEIFFVGMWAIQTPLILWLARKFPLGGVNRLSRFAVHLAAALALGLAHRFFVESVLRSLLASAERPFSWERVWQTTLGTFESGVFIYFLVLLAAQVWDYYERYNEERVQAVRLRADLSAAQLETLRMQVQPHFLFNTLNAISVLVEEDPRTAREMIGHLSDFLRATLAEGSSQEIPLRRELELLQHYLRIEQTRFGDRLRVEMSVDPGALEARVPALLLQPLVENAIRYGLARRVGPGRVEVEAALVEGTLTLEVRDLAAGPVEPSEASAATPSSGLGIGLRNTQARLRQICGEAQRFTLEPLGESGSEVTVSIQQLPAA